MPAVALLYHDVVEPGRSDASGFPGAAAGTYKLERTAFAEHLRAIAGAVAAGATSPEPLSEPRGRVSAGHALLTFDDGGRSAHTYIADALERHGWRGYFFVTTDHVGAPAFLTRGQIRELHARGHVIGSHSASHPIRMSACDRARLLHEWRSSGDALVQILGEPVTTASVPGGYYARLVAATAAAAGYAVLFTSEPTVRRERVEGCMVVGRFGMRRTTPAADAAALARGDAPPRLRQWMAWNSKKVAKTLAGPLYLQLRRLAID